MPLINGAGFLYRLRQMPAHQRTPVLLVTGMSLSAELDAELADLRAMVRFKPLDPSEFLVEIAQLVEAGRLPQTEMGHQSAPSVAQFRRVKGDSRRRSGLASTVHSADECCEQRTTGA
jgi:hypothetical protein